MNRSFSHNLRIVTAVHFLLIGVYMASSWVRSRTRATPDVVVPVQFMMVAPAAARAAIAEPVAPEDSIPEPAPKPKPKPQPKPKPKSKPEPPKDKKPAEPKHVDVPRPPSERPVKPLTAAEIRQMLMEGDKPGTPGAMPDEDALSLELIRRALYDAWAQPRKEDVGDAVAEVELRLGPGGRITGWKLVKPSGRADMDASVAQAAGSLQSVPGLSGAFLMRHTAVTVAFKLE